MKVKRNLPTLEATKCRCREASADLLCRSAAFPCPSRTSEENQKAKVTAGLCLRLLLSRSGNPHGKARKIRRSARLALQPCGFPPRRDLGGATKRIRVIFWRRGKNPHRWKSGRAGVRALRYEAGTDLVPLGRDVRKAIRSRGTACRPLRVHCRRTRKHRGAPPGCPCGERPEACPYVVFAFSGSCVTWLRSHGTSLSNANWFAS